MEKIFEINVKSSVSLDQLQEILPIIYKFTQTAQAEVKTLTLKIESLPSGQEEKAKELEKSINDLIDRWQVKIQKLGGLPKGLWLADFDFGKGYLCWKFPEKEIKFWHGYKDGFSNRQPIKRSDFPH